MTTLRLFRDGDLYVLDVLLVSSSGDDDVLDIPTDVLQEYIDESGITDSPICVVAGYVGKYRQFRKLTKKWKRIVSCLPNGDFHAHDFFGFDDKGRRIPPYDSWSDTKRRDFLNRLIDAIHSVKIRPIGAGTDVEEFFKNDLDRRIWLTGGVKNEFKWKTSGSPNNPYYLPFQHCVLVGAEDASATRKLNIFSDINKNLAPYSVQLLTDYRRVHPDLNEKLGPIDHVSRIDVVVIQCADLLAYVHLRHKTNENEEIRYALDRLIEKENNVRFFNEQGLEQALVTYVPPKRLMGEMNPQAAKNERKRLERADAKKQGI